MTPEDAVLAACAAALDGEDVVTDREVLVTYAHDRSSGSEVGEPIGVVFPRTTDQVSRILRAAQANRVPVVPRGAGSGLAGGCNAVDGSLVVCLERMDQVLLVDEADGYVETQPGVLNSGLREHVRSRGLWYAPDPASKDFCSIGGNVNTNAGGLCCVKYGVTRDAVLGLEVVLADGRITRLGRRTIKGVAGYDLAGLVVGSEGTLGIVTMARLRLHPLPPPPTTVLATFADLAGAGRAVAGIMGELTPSLLELMDRATVEAVESLLPMGLDISAAATLVAQTDAPHGGAAADGQRLGEICREHGAGAVLRSSDPQESERLLDARRMAIPAVEMLGDWLLDDIAVPRSALADAMVGMQDLAAANDVRIFTFGHAGDGNLHPMILTPRGDQEAAARAMTAFMQILDLALALGGTVTGEHGVGILKRRSLAAELDEPAVDLHHRIKAAWDPDGILNPGKALPRW